jgi:hypothetical protein
MSIRDYILTGGLLFSIGAWIVFGYGIYQLCQMACAVGAYGW